MFETIVALATAPIKGALSIIRLSGDDVFDVVSKCCSKDLHNIKERTILYASIVNKDDIVLLLGKGHEDYQILGHTKVHLDDSEEVLNWKKNLD